MGTGQQLQISVSVGMGEKIASIRQRKPLNVKGLGGGSVPAILRAPAHVLQLFRRCALYQLYQLEYIKGNENIIHAVLIHPGIALLCMQSANDGDTAA